VKLSVSEILKNASTIKSDDHRISYLKANYSVALETIIRGAFDPRIKWQLPEGSPPYKPNSIVDQQHVLFTECRRMYLFIEGGHPDLKQNRREQLFVELLEALDPEDAKLMLAVKEKHLPYPGITPELIRRGFPGVLSELEAV
jgi:hypothetical protein